MKSTDNYHLKKSKLLFKVYGGFILFSLFISIVIRPLFDESLYFLDLLVGLPVLITVFLSPLGLYYSIKSIKQKEASKVLRYKYLYYHLFFCVLILLFISVFISDVKQFF
ncbi:MAG TPA: hypothetical protein DHV30_16095 [Balneola sp.]|nr:hypothetical protein [Balneola sp.]|tara:strand:+ start:3956 stop:4285 length:330 start_codon:yes stop_codon:yes gene_type:complete